MIALQTELPQVQPFRLVEGRIGEKNEKVRSRFKVSQEIILHLGRVLPQLPQQTLVF